MDFTREFLQMFFVTLWYAAPVTGLLVLVIIVLGHLIGTRESWSWADSVYYTFVTATTLGYGDFHPKKQPSKMLAIAISFVGLVLTGIIVAFAIHAAGYGFKGSPAYKQLVDEVEQIEKAYE